MERQEPQPRRQADPREADAEALLDEREPGSLGKNERPARPPRLAIMQNPGNWRRAACRFEQPRSVCRRNGAHHFRLRKPLLHSKYASGQYDNWVSPVGLTPEKSQSPSAEGDGDDLIGFGTARGGDFNAL